MSQVSGCIGYISNCQSTKTVRNPSAFILTRHRVHLHYFERLRCCLPGMHTVWSTISERAQHHRTPSNRVHRPLLLRSWRLRRSMGISRSLWCCHHAVAAPSGRHFDQVSSHIHVTVCRLPTADLVMIDLLPRSLMRASCQMHGQL